MKSDLVLVKEHIGNALVDGEAATGLGAEESAFLKVKLQKGVVELAEEVVGVEHGSVGLVGELGIADGAWGVDEGFPLNLGEDVYEEVGA